MDPPLPGQLVNSRNGVLDLGQVFDKGVHVAALFPVQPQNCGWLQGPNVLERDQCGQVPLDVLVSVLNLLLNDVAEDTQFWIIPGLATNSILFCFLFVKKSLICLEGKSMTPRRGNTFLFRSSQQLPRLRLGPLKGFLS